MTIYIVDTNVIFSSALNITNSMGRFIMSSSEYEVELYAPDYLRVEIEKYIPKLLTISGIKEPELRRIINLLYSKITFIEDKLIPFDYYKNSLPLVRDVDINDLVFVALNEYMDELLWTGDMRLYRGLKAKGYDKVISFSEIKKKFKIE